MRDGEPVRNWEANEATILKLVGEMGRDIKKGTKPESLGILGFRIRDLVGRCRFEKKIYMLAREFLLIRLEEHEIQGSTFSVSGRNQLRAQLTSLKSRYSVQADYHKRQCENLLGARHRRKFSFFSFSGK